MVPSLPSSPWWKSWLSHVWQVTGATAMLSYALQLLSPSDSFAIRSKSSMTRAPQSPAPSHASCHTADPVRPCPSEAPAKSPLNDVMETSSSICIYIYIDSELLTIVCDMLWLCFWVLTHFAGLFCQTSRHLQSLKSASASCLKLCLKLKCFSSSLDSARDTVQEWYKKELKMNLKARESRVVERRGKWCARVQQRAGAKSVGLPALLAIAGGCNAAQARRPN